MNTEIRSIISTFIDEEIGNDRTNLLWNKIQTEQGRDWVIEHIYQLMVTFPDFTGQQALGQVMAYQMELDRL